MDVAKNGLTRQYRLVAQNMFQSVREQLETAVIGNFDECPEILVEFVTISAKDRAVVLPVELPCLLEPHSAFEINCESEIAAISELLSVQLKNPSWTKVANVELASKKRKLSETAGSQEFLVYLPNSPVHLRVSLLPEISDRHFSRKLVFAKGELEWHVFLGERNMGLSINTEFLKTQIARLKLNHSHGLSLALRDLLRNALALSRKWEPAISDSLHCPGFLDFAAGVRAHYDEKTARHLRQEASRVGSLRKFNNLIKSALIERFMPERDRAAVTPRKQVKVLDLACGQGQDLLKYRGRDVGLWVGVDIAPAAVAEAKSRYNESWHSRKLDYHAEFVIGNLLEEETFNEIGRIAGNTDDGNGQFDVISVQFALHYIANEPESAENFLRKVSALLKPGGWLIGTVPCGDRFAENLAKAEPSEDAASGLEFGNDVYKVSIDKEMLGNLLPGEDLHDAQRLKEVLGERWGIKYSFWLDETIDNQEEFLVPFTVLSEIAIAHDLKCELRANFTTAFDRFAEKSKVIREFRNRNPTDRLSEAEQECFAFYRVFAFRKSQ